MKTTLVLDGVFLLFVFCAAGPAKAQEGGAGTGIDIVDVVKTSATVQNINLETRKVLLVLEDGKKKTLRVDQRVRNLDQVRTGDHVKLSYANEIVVLVGKTKEIAGADAAGLVAIAPRVPLPVE
jgi:hypothetical protein